MSVSDSHCACAECVCIETGGVRCQAALADKRYDDLCDNCYYDEFAGRESDGSV